MPKVLWMSSYCLHDTTSGASRHAFYLLQNLIKQGFTVWSFSNFACDRSNGAKTLLNKLKISQAQTSNRLYTLDEDGIHYIFSPNKGTDELKICLGESQLYYNLFCQVLDEYHPDFIISYGLSPLPIVCRYEAQRRGIKIIQMICNGEQKTFSFPHIDLLISDSYATSNFYAASDLLNIRVPGIYLEIETILAPTRQPKFVTFINPSIIKGASIFVRLLDLCEQKLPEVKFLAIETRGAFYQDIRMLHTKGNPQEHPYTDRRFKNLMLLPTQSSIKNVYAITKVLLAPSLWYESWGRVTSEAVINHIPVLCSTSGGLSEAMREGGIAIEAPEHCRKDYLSLPTDEEIQPWFEALQRLLTEDWIEACKRSAPFLSPEQSTLKLLQLMHDLHPQVCHGLKYKHLLHAADAARTLTDDELNDLDDELSIQYPYDPSNLFKLEAPTTLSFNAQLQSTLPLPGSLHEVPLAQQPNLSELTVQLDSLPLAKLTADETSALPITPDEDGELSTLPLPERAKMLPLPDLSYEVILAHSGHGPYTQENPSLEVAVPTQLGVIADAQLTDSTLPADPIELTIPTEVADHCLESDVAKRQERILHPLRFVSPELQLPAQDSFVDKCNVLDLPALLSIMQRAAQAQ